TKKAELVATLLFTEKELKKKGDMAERDVLNEVMKWKERRSPPFDKTEVAETIRDLGVLKWFTLKPSKDLPINANF
ncbi:MAG: Appr-1-p processing protein, partial [Elusimicrobia bacterium CG_4_10_14_3_um_filter_49_12_50_7]